MPRRLTRRRFLFSLAALPAAGLAGGSWARLIEPEWIELTRKEIPLPGLSRPLRVAHLSDFHVSPQAGCGLTERAVEMTLAREPDLIALTGDYITWQITDRERYVAALKKLAAAAPVFACLGNHDGGRWAGRARGYADPAHVVSLFDESGIRFLFNERVTERAAGCELDLVGLGDLWSGDCRPQNVRDFRSKKRPTLVLSHNPDSKELLRPFAWDLLLCGHTHGGQLVIPFLGLRPFLPVRDKTFPEGLRRWEGRWVHITRGVGNLHGLRFNCRPEASLLDLVPA